MKHTTHQRAAALLAAAGPVVAGFALAAASMTAGTPVASGFAGHGLASAQPAVVGVAHPSLNDIKYPDKGGD